MTLLSRSALLILPFALAGCASPNSGGAMSTFGNIVMFQSTTPPPADQLPKDEEETLVCPEVIIQDGGASLRAQGAGDSGALRHQISLTNVARECTPTGNGGFRLKIGAEGRVLLGPSGGSGSYYATLNMQVLRGTSVVARRSARVGGSIPSGQGGTDFAHVEDGIVVPAGRGDVEIIVGLGQGGGQPARSRRR